MDEATKALSGEDISGSWSGELVVTDVNGESPIDVGQKRNVRGDGFVITQDGSDIKLRFQNSEISGKMEGGNATLTSGPTGTVIEAVLISTQGKLKVLLKQKAPTDAVITSEGLLAR